MQRFKQLYYMQTETSHYRMVVQLMSNVQGRRPLSRLFRNVHYRDLTQSMYITDKGRFPFKTRHTQCTYFIYVL